MRIVKFVFFFLAFVAMSCNTTWAFDNGGYFAFKASYGISPEDYAKDIYLNVIATTFPVCGDVALQSTLLKSYNVKTMTPNDYLLKECSKKTYGFIYVPRTVYDYMYLVFAREQKPKEIEEIIKLIATPDISMYMAWLKGGNPKLVEYFASIIMNPATIQLHANFNAWGIAFLTKNDSKLASFMKQKIGKSIIRFDNDYLHGIITALNKSNPDTAKFAKLDEKLFIVSDLENKSDGTTFLTRYVEDGPNGMNWMTQVKGKTVTADTYSMSFGPGIFAAALGGDQHASTYPHMNTANTFVTPISIKDYREGKDIAGYFFIPPYPAILQHHFGMNELWHPRTKFFAVTGKNLSVAGVGDYTVYNYINNDWTKVGWMMYENGKKFKEKEVIEWSNIFNNYIKSNSVIFIR